MGFARPDGLPVLHIHLAGQTGVVAVVALREEVLVEVAEGHLRTRFHTVVEGVGRAHGGHVVHPGRVELCHGSIVALRDTVVGRHPLVEFPVGGALRQDVVALSGAHIAEGDAID